MHWFQGRQIRTRDLDGIARNGENDNVFPGMEFIFVFDHLRALPIILNAGALEGELFDLDGDGAACLGFDDGDVVFGLCGGGSSEKLRRSGKNSQFVQSEVISVVKSVLGFPSVIE
mmetsp:Transcript_17946/g.36063  ORF Transcript_17946/g.36063 Transcript_17946/m.36063 type:complete len:116 (-) Transcript_17946:525-872(-)